MGTYHEYMLEGISDKRNLSIHRQSLQQTGTLSVETEDVGQPLTSKGRDPVSIFCRAKCSSTLKSEREWKKRKNRWLTSWQLVQWNSKKIHETNSSHSLIVHINVKCHLNDNGGMGVSNLHVNKPPCKRCMWRKTNKKPLRPNESVNFFSTEHLY